MVVVIAPLRLKDHRPEVQIPRRTYVSVPMSIVHAGGRVTFRDDAPAWA